MWGVDVVLIDVSARPSAAQPADVVANRFSVRVLGALTVEVGGDPLPIRRGLPRQLLSWLVLERGRPVPSDVLVDRLWGERLPSHPANALQTQVAYLRRALGGNGVAPIETTPAGYLLAGVEVDVDGFDLAIAEGRRRGAGSVGAELHRAVAAYDVALRLWRGTPYPEIVGAEAADAEIVRLEEGRLAALEERADVLLRLGRTADAIADLRALVSGEPLRERAQELLALALYRAGRQSDALRCLNRARRTLVEQLGVEPGPALRELERRILDHDPTLDIAIESRAVETPVAPVERRCAVGNPTAGGDLVGRERDITRVRRLLGEHRLLTITGPGGAGKTRLAQEVAATCGATRVHTVDLGDVVEGGDVREVLAGAVGVQVSAPADIIGAVTEGLTGGNVLLVLDTCERVSADAGAVVVELLAALPELTILATSRRPLGVPGELTWPIPPLAVPTAGTDATRAPAFELFVRRARQADAGFRLSEHDVPVVADLCRALDGLPLAIELAAAQMDVLTPEAVLTQLDERRSLGSRVGGPERQRTLGATTEWSVGLLDGAQRDMLHRLAVFPSSFDVDAAIAVAGSGRDDALERFVALVRNSLVVATDDGRYRLLDTVRRHLLASDTDAARHDDACRCHARHYAAIATRSFAGVRGAAQAAWLRRVEQDRANLRHALAWCFGPGGEPELGARIAGDVAWAWTLSGNLLDARAALDAAGQVEAEPMVRARVLLGVGLLAAPLGDHAAVIDACTRSAELGRSAGRDDTVAAALLTLGVSRWATGDLPGAATAHDEAIERFEAAGDPWGATICRILRARTARDDGDIELSTSLLDVAVDDAKATVDDHVIGLAYEQLARLLLERGRPAPALAAAEVALAHNEAVGYAEGISAALTVAALARASAGSVEPARTDLRQALTVAARIGHVGAMCAGVEVAAMLAELDGDPAAAVRLLLVARRTRRRVQLPLPPTAQRDVDARLDRVRHLLGDAAWEDLTVEAQMHSLDEVVADLVGDAVTASPGDGRLDQDSISSGWPASTHASLPPS